MISIISPVYNVALYLVEFLDSLLAQTYGEFEAILVDDGSTDGSGEILEQYALKDSRIKVIHKENGGCVSAWKCGLILAKGEYISFADPDDVLLPEMLERNLALMLENDVDLVIEDYKILTGSNLSAGRASMSLWNKYFHYGIYRDKNLNELKDKLFGDSEHLLPILLFFKWNKFFKREILMHNIGYFDENISFCDDVPLVASYVLDCNGIFYSDDQLYIYRRRPGSINVTFIPRKNISSAVALMQTLGRMARDKHYDCGYLKYSYRVYHINVLLANIARMKAGSEKSRTYRLLQASELVQGGDLKKAREFMSERQYRILLLFRSRLLPYSFITCYYRKQ